MPRLPRLHVPGGCYHVVMRGNHCEDLFSTPHDRHRSESAPAKYSLDILHDIARKGASQGTRKRITAYCSKRDGLVFGMLIKNKRESR